MSVRGQTTSRHFVAFRDRPKVTTFVAFGSVPKLHFLSLLGQVENNFQDIFILYESVVGDAPTSKIEISYNIKRYAGRQRHQPLVFY